MNAVRLYGAFTLAIACVLCNCSRISISGGEGNGSETIAKGHITDENGSLVANAMVSLLPFSYNPTSDTVLPGQWQTLTDNNGEYHISRVVIGSYNLEAYSANNGKKGLVQNIHVSDVTNEISIDTARLRVPGTIDVRCDSAVLHSGDYLYITGTSVYTIVDAQSLGKGFVTLFGVPTGRFASIIHIGSAETQNLLLDTITVSPGSKISVPYSAWKFSKRLVLNTAASGAAVPGSVYNFPVLVRLTRSNFNFAQSAGRGADLRFAKSDGTPLSYEIERWDSVAAAADVWVSIDTVYGNDSTHSITMYWGLRSTGSATSESNSAAVFDTALGNIGVWHLGPGLSDATIYGDNGIDSSTADATGIISRCRHFNPALPSFITIPNESRFDITTNITLSAWVQVDSIKALWQAIITKGDNTYRLHCDTALKAAVFSTSTFAANQTDTVLNSLYSKTRIDDHQWHFICGVFDGSVMRIYIDGNLEGERLVSTPCQTNDFNVMIGNNGRMPKRFYAGSIDEVRIMHAVMNVNWVKLCYMNQKEIDRLIIFR
jgi:hypothetical protein